ncbi:Inner membrane protein yohK [Leminorella richardii]|uniref:Inner membrane protein yohK n=1 Tax=Leminorella richardii TaxID=158841 RepID=A0A2X4XNG7_9GAMM|nr:CidB/LrgB family autolysis modulator [Leminorella richardii]SQI41475.1 Inner membrane protein yohK [Leminorella richardii]
MWWAIPLTMIAFYGARQLAIKLKMPLLNPMLISLLIIIPLLLLTHTSYDSYYAGSAPMNALLQPAVVALAFPLYEQLHQIRARWKSLLLICLVGSVLAMVSGAAVVLWLGSSPEIAASVLPKSVTMPIAMATSHAIGGIPAVSAICVMFVGIFGAVFGYPILKLLRITTPAARGLSIGATAHALGTARCVEEDYQEGAYSSLALAICGVITSLSAPLIFPILIQLFS